MTEQYPPHPDLDPEPPTGRRRCQAPYRRTVSPWALSGLLAVLVAAVWLVVAALDGDDPAVTPAEVPKVLATSTVAAPPSSASPPSADLPEGAFSGDPPETEGPYVVGQDMPVGRYLTAGPLAVGEPGTWERHRLRSRSGAAGGTPDLEMVATGTVEGPEVIVVKAGDRLVVRGLKPLYRVA